MKLIFVTVSGAKQATKRLSLATTAGQQQQQQQQQQSKQFQTNRRANERAHTHTHIHFSTTAQWRQWQQQLLSIAHSLFPLIALLLSLVTAFCVCIFCRTVTCVRFHSFIFSFAPFTLPSFILALSSCAVLLFPFCAMQLQRLASEKKL